MVVLCGGLGTRIREASERLPKPMIEIGGRPIIWHVLKIYASHGYRRFILCLGYRSWDIKEYFLRYRENVSDFTVALDGSPPFFHTEVREPWQISLVETGLHTGTGGRLLAVSHLIDTPHFAVTYADGVGDVNLRDEFDDHVSSDAEATVVGIHPTSRYGELEVHGRIVTSFAEKPASAAWVSAGYFMFGRSFLDRLHGCDPSTMFEESPLRGVASDGGLRMYPHEGFWMGMDTYREYVHLNRLWETGEAAWKMWDD